MAKQERLHLRLTEEDREAFEQVTQALGMSNMSQAVRFVMLDKHRSLFGVQLPKKRPAKRRRSTS